MRKCVIIISILSLLLVATYPVHASESSFGEARLTVETASQSTLDQIAQIPIYITTTEGTTGLSDV